MVRQENVIAKLSKIWIYWERHGRRERIELRKVCRNFSLISRWRSRKIRTATSKRRLVAASGGDFDRHSSGIAIAFKESVKENVLREEIAIAKEFARCRRLPPRRHHRCPGSSRFRARLLTNASE